MDTTHPSSNASRGSDFGGLYALHFVSHCNRNFVGVVGFKCWSVHSGRCFVFVDLFLSCWYSHTIYLYVIDSEWRHKWTEIYHKSLYSVSHFLIISCMHVLVYHFSFIPGKFERLQGWVIYAVEIWRLMNIHHLKIHYTLRGIGAA